MLKSKRSTASKFLTVALAGAFLSTGMLPVTEASAGHRHKAHKHAHKHHKRHKRRNNDGDLIAAGIIGLAIGAIIASSANDRRRRADTYNGYDHYPVPPDSTSYGYQEPYYDGYDGDVYGGVRRQPLSDYNGGGYSQPHTDNGPRVVTYEETVSLEPWSPGWYRYCTQKFRSFDPQKGTYRGFDGLDHFCVAR